MTDAQADHLRQMTALGHKLLDYKATAEEADDSAYGQTQSALDWACLLFCVSLLDHDLKRDLFESVVVGFLAVARIDFPKRVFKQPSDYTPLLSGLIKIGQMLVMQRAVVAVEDGDIGHSSDMLDKMHERLITGESRLPLECAIWLRAYGKKIKNTTTSSGHIQ